MSKYTMNEIAGYLATKNVPRQMIQQIREALACDAVEEASNVHWDRIYTAIGLAAYERYGYDAQEIMGLMSDINGIMMRLDDDNVQWSDLMAELKDKTGLVIQAGNGVRVIWEGGLEEQ